MKITKRNGTEQDFDQDKILSAISRANATVPEQDRLTDAQIKGIVAGVVCSATTSGSQPTVESVQDSVEDWLMGSGKHKVAKAYITYRYLHQLARDHYKDLMTRVGEKVHATKVANQNANVDEEAFGGRLGESASLVMRELAMNGGMSKLAAENHKNNMIYTHDLDHFVLGTHNCLSIPMDKLLAEGFTVKQTDIRPAQSINTACQLVAVIFQIQSLQQFGGVAATHLDHTLSKYVIKSLFKHYILELLKQSEVFDSWDVAKYSVMKLDAKLDEVKSKLKSKLDESEFRIYMYEDQIPEHIDRKAYKRALLETRIELEQAIEGLYHNLNSLQSRSGNQLPFTSLNYGTCTEPEGRLVTEQVLCTSIRGIGKKDRTPIFPCGIFQLKDGINKKYTDPNYDLFRLALRSTALRLYPNYVNCDWSAQKAWLKADRDFRKKLLEELSDTQMAILISKLEKSEYLRRRFRMSVAHYPDGSKWPSVYHKEEPNEIMSTMGCRTANGLDLQAFESIRKNLYAVIEDKPFYDDIESAVQKDGRGNICPVTIIMPTLAMEADRDVEKFMKLLDTKIHEAKDQLLERFEYICSQSWKAAKFMYGNGSMAGYVPEEGIRSALRHGTIVIGQLGLAETLQILIGKDHTTEEGMQLAIRIESLFKQRVAEFREKYQLNFGVYYTPAENLCYTALKKFRERYGIIPNVSDKEFFTNSMHIPVWKHLASVDKIELESMLTGYSSAGCMSYIELSGSIKNNIDAEESLVLFGMDHDVPYMGINLPNDQCQSCGYIGDIPGKCPKCDSDDVLRLRRVTGYLGTDYHQFNPGKVDEVEHRVQHQG